MRRLKQDKRGCVIGSDIIWVGKTSKKIRHLVEPFLKRLDCRDHAKVLLLLSNDLDYVSIFIRSRPMRKEDKV